MLERPIDLEEERAARDILIEELARSLGDRLQAVYRFGSELGRGKGAGHPRVLVLIDRIDRPTLDRVAEHVTTAQKAGVRVRVDCCDNLLCGADAFPSFSLELRDSRELLHGEDVLVDLKVDPKHLRLHVEQGLRGLHRDLIKAYVERGNRGDDVLALRRSTRRLLFLLEGALIAAGHETPDTSSVDAIIDAACEALLSECDTKAWDALKRFARGEGKLRGEEAKAFYGAMLAALPAVVDAVDKLPQHG
jgi:hypothetical protein